MAEPSFDGHAARAKRNQWRLDDLPWDEPFKFCGASKREQTFCRMNALQVGSALYYFQLANRMRMADHLVRSWQDNAALISCLEWHDLDEHRHMVGLRLFIERIKHAGEDLPTPNKDPDVSEGILNLARPIYASVDPDALRLNLLIDEAFCVTIFNAAARGCNVPITRAFFRACAEDDARHVDYLIQLNAQCLRERSSRQQTMLQAGVIAHLARLLGAFRKTIPSVAGLAGTGAESVATDAFHGVSDALGALGPHWQREGLARFVHEADSSPWLLWLLR